MENKEIYNEVYGWMPKNLVNKLPNEVRLRLITMWLNRHATDTGWFIVAAVLKELGDEFIKYLFNQVITSIKEDGDEPERGQVINIIRSTLEAFASDTNILFNFVQDYFKQKGEIPFVDVSSLMPGGEEKESQPRDSKGRFTKKE